MAQKAIRVQKLRKAETDSDKKIISIVFIVCLAFYSTAQDPFNVPKFITLILGASYLIPHLYSISKLHVETTNKLFTKLVAAFLFFGLFSAIFSGSKTISFLGDTQRRNGYITYLALAIISLYALRSRIVVSNFYKSIVLLAGIMSIYGIFQSLNIDFIPWSSSGGIISTVGNSNFAGATFSLFSILLTILIFTNEFSNKWKIVNLIILLTSLFSLIKTNAKQGILIYLMLIGYLIVLILWRKNKVIGKFIFLCFSVLILIGLFGVFNKGPMAEILYKSTIQTRQYYWVAAIRMFIHYPIFGVGFDRYGYYFKSFSDSDYGLNYGFDLTSTNAHNVILQFFATGGLILGLPFLFLCFYWLFKVFKICRAFIRSEANFLELGFAFGWLAYFIQSLVSIDFIGVAIWGWVFGGLIAKNKLIFEKDKYRSFMKLDLVHAASYFFIVMSLVLSFYLIKAENGMYRIRSSYNPQNTSETKYFVDLSKKTLNLPFLDSYYRATIAAYLIDYGELSYGNSLLTQYLNEDKRDRFALIYLSYSNEVRGEILKAIEYREKILELEPFNAKNMLDLGRDYKKVNQIDKMNNMRIKILSFARQTNEGKQALEELTI